jgi:hypothetical protein
MEMRRKQEELERLRLEEEDRKAALMLQEQLEMEAKEDTQYRQQLEQERRDHELALRLALESNGQIDESPTLSRKYVEGICEWFFRFHNFTDICTKKQKVFSVEVNEFSAVNSLTFRLCSKISEQPTKKKITEDCFFLL